MKQYTPPTPGKWIPHSFMAFILCIVCHFFITTTVKAQAFSPSPAMQAIVAGNRYQSPQEFLKNFPYADYLKYVEFTDFSTLQQDRNYLYTALGEGDAFLYHLGQNFIKDYPVGSSLPDLTAKTTIGLFYLNAKGRGIHSRNEEPYHIVGYYILGQVSAKLSEMISAKKLNPDDPDTAALIAILSRNKVQVAFERSTLSKLIHNVKNGKWDYILNRITNKVREVVKSENHKATANNRGKPKLNKTTTDIQLKPFRAFHSIGRNKVKMNAFVATNRKDGTPIGHIVFLHRPSAKAGYLATCVQKRLSQNRNPLVAMTGGFTNNYKKPEGLTIDRGQIVNAVLMHDRDALVLVEANGGIRVLNLDRPEITLPGYGNIKNPRQDLVAFSQLLQWCRVTKATTFQTQLLAFGDDILIDRSKASSALAERRLLALASDKTTGEVTHAIFNIRKPHSLADLAEKACHVLEVRNLKIEALLNLDTGGQDVMELYDENRRVVPQVKGRLGTSQTTNLLVYSY